MSVGVIRDVCVLYEHTQCFKDTSVAASMLHSSLGSRKLGIICFLCDRMGFGSSAWEGGANSHVSFVIRMEATVGRGKRQMYFYVCLCNFNFLNGA